MLNRQEKVSPETILTDFFLQISEDLPQSDGLITEEHEILLDIIYDYFLENFQDYSFKESYINVIENDYQDKNQELFKEIAEIVLDETIGKMVSTILHPVDYLSNKLAQRKFEKNTNKTNLNLTKAANSSSKIAKAYYSGKAQKTATRAANSLQKQQKLQTKSNSLAQKIDNSLPGKLINNPKSVIKTAASSISKIPSNIANRVGRIIA